MPENSSSSFDIFGLLSEEKPKPSPEEEKKKRRKELLEPTGVNEIYKEGKISINKFTCVGAQCQYCIKACPTNALYWSGGQVGIIEDLCVYCSACVLSCMVDDCIKLERTREDGTVERLSKPKDVILLTEKRNSQKRVGRVKTVYPTLEEYCYKHPPLQKPLKVTDLSKYQPSGSVNASASTPRIHFYRRRARQLEKKQQY